MLAALGIDLRLLDSPYTAINDELNGFERAHH